MDLGEPHGGDGDVLQANISTANYLGPLAIQAVAGPIRHLLDQPCPYIPGGDEATGGMHSWLGNTMEVVKNLSQKMG